MDGEARPPAERRSELTVAASPSPLSQRSHGISGEVIHEKILEDMKIETDYREKKKRRCALQVKLSLQQIDN